MDMFFFSFVVDSRCVVLHLNLTYHSNCRSSVDGDSADGCMSKIAIQIYLNSGVEVVSFFFGSSKSRLVLMLAIRVSILVDRR